MRYKRYSAADFANDSFFIRWVKHPDEESDWFWRSLMEEYPACKPEVEQARALISALDFPEHHLSEEESRRMRHGFLMALHANIEGSRDSKPLRKQAFSWSGNRWMRVAATVVIGLLVAAGLFFFFREGADHTVLQAQAEKKIEKRVNPNGQKSVLFLSDGTKVWLNAASKISYAENFDDQPAREVYLEGEAFFDVAPDAHKVFVVHTASLRIKVLGTSFNVKSYDEEKTIETTLVHGKVRIEHADASGGGTGEVELKPNQRAVFNKRSGILKIRDVVVDNSISWKQEKLVFDEESIDNVILQMERWFNVRIHVQNKGTLDCKLTASIEKESLEDVLKLLETSHKIRYRVEGNDVYIEGGLCQE